MEGGNKTISMEERQNYGESLRSVATTMMSTAKILSYMSTLLENKSMVNIEIRLNEIKNIATSRVTEAMFLSTLSYKKYLMGEYNEEEVLTPSSGYTNGRSGQIKVDSADNEETRETGEENSVTTDELGHTQLQFGCKAIQKVPEESKTDKADNVTLQTMKDDMD